MALLSRQLARAPGWKDLRHFSVAAIAYALYALLDLPTTAPVLSDRAVWYASRVQFALLSLHSWAWVRYSAAVLDDSSRRVERWADPLLLGLGITGLFTPWFLPGEVVVTGLAAFGLHYRTAASSTLGGVAYVVALGTLVVPIVRLRRAQRQGLPNAGLQVGALVVLLVTGLNDILVVAGVYQAPYLVSVAFLLPITAVAYALTERFIGDAKAHVELQRELERQVNERTAELGRAQDALHRAEKLAALGQFAAGVAHEVNNPAAVIAANLQYLTANEAEVLSSSGKDAVDESLLSVTRISTIVRQLLDAGRLAAAAESAGSVRLRPLGDHALSVARARFGRRVLVTNRIPEALHALGQETVIVQVLVNLIVNAVQAIEPHRTDGHVIASAEADGDRVRLLVEDNGAGMPPEVLRRVFEPFFTTKAFGAGTGLGLAVSRGLIAGMGGDLRLESEAGKGTRATVELPLAAPGDVVAAPRAEPARGPRLTMLIVDDEATVLTSLRRLLAPGYELDVATGVDEALGLLGRTRFDVVLCDVMMPSGGGERLFRTLLERDPAAARRVVFFTGGAVTEAARVFLRSQPQPVLEKPLDIAELARAAERLRTPQGDLH
ncbi:MAG: ATP-binding protein [Anaeromyxobacteraceae bacterium]